MLRALWWQQRDQNACFLGVVSPLQTVVASSAQSRVAFTAGFPSRGELLLLLSNEMHRFWP